MAWGLLALIVARESVAAEWYLDSRLGQQFSYDDNVGLQSTGSNSGGGQDGQFGSTSSIGLTTGGRTPDVNVALTSLFNFTEYPNQPDLGSQDQFFTLVADRQGERWGAGVTGQFNYDTTRTSDVEDTGEFIQENVRREFFSIAPRVSHRLTEADQLSLSTSYGNTHYDVEDLADSENLSTQMGWRHALTERTSFLANASASRVNRNTRGSDNSRYYGLLVGGSHRFSEDLSATFTAGPTVAENAAVTSRSGERQAERSVVASYGIDASVAYKLEERLSFQAALSRSETASATTGAVNNDTRLRIGASYQVFPNLFVETPLSVLHREATGDRSSDTATAGSNNSQTGGSGSGSRDFVSFEPTLRWRLDPDWNFSVGYRVRWQSDDNNTAISQAVLTSLNYQLPHLSASR